MLTFEQGKEIVKKFGANEKDSGRTEVQIALITKRLENLAPHFEKHKHDYNSSRGLMKLIGQRKSLLRYLQGKSEDRYQKLIKELGLRK